MKNISHIAPRIILIAILGVCAFTEIRAATNDYFVLTLRDGKTVEGKVVEENLSKLVVEYQQRGITWQQTVYRSSIASAKILSPEELERRAKVAAQTVVTRMPSTALPPTTAAQFAPAAQPTTAQSAANNAQLLDQARAFLTQKKFGEAVQCLEQYSSTAVKADLPTDPQQLLQETYAAWLANLQASHTHLTNQISRTQQALDQTKKVQEATQQKLDKLRDQARNPQVVQRTSNRYGTTDGTTDGTRSGTTTTYTSSDAYSQGDVNTLQINLMTLTREADSRSGEMTRLQQELALVDHQIAAIQARQPREEPWYYTHWKWLVVGSIVVLCIVLRFKTS